MKRRWIGLIILLAVGMSIIGVSKQQRPVQSEDESITLRVVLWDYDVVIYDRELIENFEKDHPDIKIDVISYPPTYYNSSLTALLDSGGCYLCKSTGSTQSNYGSQPGNAVG